MELKRFRQLLKVNGHFNTRARYELFLILQKHPALTLKMLIKLLPNQDKVTVYRNVDLFEKLGIINRLRLGWETRIELSDMFIHHHHHFTCNHCGQVYDLPDNQIMEKEIAKLAASGGFKPTDHQLEIRGFCQKCDNLTR